MKEKAAFLCWVDNDAESLAYFGHAASAVQLYVLRRSDPTAKETIETVTTAVPLLMMISLNLKVMDSYDFILLLKEYPRTSSVSLIAEISYSCKAGEEPYNGTVSRS
jgi:CheY-like chemotaxis protein